MSDVTRILSQINQGDPVAAAQLLPLVYNELRRLAAAKMARENPGQTLSATALVHEAFLRLIGDSSATTFSDRAHFFRVAAEAMRQILVDNARRKRAVKHGGGLARADLADVAAPEALDIDDVIAVSEALAKFEQQDPAKAELVKLRYFAGLTVDQAAETLNVSTATAERHWAYAKAWLYRELARSNQHPPAVEKQKNS